MEACKAFFFERGCRFNAQKERETGRICYL
nr:MAG TPA: hypothetical protein [Caudoviricetes sp.]